MAHDASPVEHDEFGELLSDAELQRISGGKDRPTAQARALKRMGMPCRLEGGVVIASRHHLREWIKGGATAANDGFNWRSLE